MSDFSDSDKNSPSIAISLKEATLFALSPMKLYKLWIVLKAFFQFSTKDNESHRDTCKKFKKSLTNLTNQYFISATFRTCFFISFSSFSDNKIRCKYYNKKKKSTSITISTSQLVTMVMFNHMTKKKVNWTVPFTRTVVLIHLHMTK